jgi:membrane protein DedA with SNARE-associated domain
MILRNLLFFTAILLIIGWVLGFWVWKHEGHTIHILLVLAVISLVLAITRKPGKDPID